MSFAKDIMGLSADGRVGLWMDGRRRLADQAPAARWGHFSCVAHASSTATGTPTRSNCWMVL